MLVKKVKAHLVENDTITPVYWYHEICNDGYRVNRTVSLRNIIDFKLNIQRVEIKTPKGEFILTGEFKIIKKRDGRLVLECQGMADIFSIISEIYVLDDFGSYIRII